MRACGFGLLAAPPEAATAGFPTDGTCSTACVCVMLPRFLLCAPAELKPSALHASRPVQRRDSAGRTRIDGMSFPCPRLRAVALSASPVGGHCPLPGLAHSSAHFNFGCKREERSECPPVGPELISSMAGKKCQAKETCEKTTEHVKLCSTAGGMRLPVLVWCFFSGNRLAAGLCLCAGCVYEWCLLLVCAGCVS